MCSRGQFKDTRRDVTVVKIELQKQVAGQVAVQWLGLLGIHKYYSMKFLNTRALGI